MIVQIKKFHKKRLIYSKMKRIKRYRYHEYWSNWKYLSEWLGSIGKWTCVASSFNCDYGKNIYLGSDITMNFNVTILDIRKITIGDNTMIGPKTLITSVGHPLSPKGRRSDQEFAKPITIENDVWIEEM